MISGILWAGAFTARIGRDGYVFRIVRDGYIANDGSHASCKVTLRKDRDEPIDLVDAIRLGIVEPIGIELGYDGGLVCCNDAGERLYDIAGKSRTLADCADVVLLMHQSLAVYH